MKNLRNACLLLLAAGFFTTATAQDNSTRSEKGGERRVYVQPDPNHAVLQNRRPAVDNAMFFRDGKMVIVKSGTEYPYGAETTLQNGTRVMPDGTLITRDGQRTRLREDQYIDEKGKVCDWKQEKTQ